ncbi:hypothetical protein PILCRDRAFT_824860 [Piloderma croceum F 1598]|uniref:Protein kinase domain-containing protein n=1 Tax=Piloderma croceum (strain F 1598) TaxID=765440 RepID=A0A0C3EZB6_PILCF|nr:hypothetical protein PILCRDRAFT_824860 [Piloderma croceum F 1598]
MDVVHLCLSLTPVPGLAPAFSALRFIWLLRNAQSIAQLLKALDGEYRSGRLLQARTSTSLADLHKLLEEISAFIQKEASCGFLKLLFTKDQRIVRIESYYRRIDISIESFQISALLNINTWQVRNDDARADDQQLLNERLLQLERNQERLIEALKRQFFSHALRYLTTASGRQVEMESWMITSYEVEFGHRIGSGGFGEVFMGTWNNTQVAIKVMKTEGGIMPSSTAIRREIETWSILRHTHVLQFLRANELDDRPFIVMPYLKNGNARDYVQSHPDCDLLQIVYHIVLGLVYLHSRKVVHGDLKALNVLIDDNGRAVLCDFGLSRIKADATSRTARPVGESIVGSRNWMAPEQLLGGLLKKPCDIYALGMTIYEIYTNEIPLGHINYADFIELVVQRNVRPEWPDDDDAPQLSDMIWELAKACWIKEPKERPTAVALCTTISHLLETTPIARPSQDASPGLSLETLSIARPTPDAAHARPSTPPPNLIIRGHTGIVYCATFSVDGKQIVSGSSDHSIRVWDAQTGNPVLGPLKMHTHAVYNVAFSPNGRRIASGSGDDTILVWHALTGKVVAGPFKGHTNSIWSICFSPDGKHIASGSADKTIRIWDAQTGNLLVGPLRGHTGSVMSVAFSGDGTRIASGSIDKTVRVWDAMSGRLVLGPLTGHKDWVYFVAFSPDSKRIVSASRVGDVCVWNANMGVLVAGPSLRHAEGALAVAFAPKSSYSAVSPDGRWIAACADDTCRIVSIWDSKTGQVAASLEGYTDAVTSITFSPDSRRVLTSSQDTTIRVHTLDS